MQNGSVLVEPLAGTRFLASLTSTMSMPLDLRLRRASADSDGGGTNFMARMSSPRYDASAARWCDDDTPTAADGADSDSAASSSSGASVWNGRKGGGGKFENARNYFDLGWCMGTGVGRGKMSIFNAKIRCLDQWQACSLLGHRRKSYLDAAGGTVFRNTFTIRRYSINMYNRYTRQFVFFV